MFTFESARLYWREIGAQLRCLEHFGTLKHVDIVGSSGRTNNPEKWSSMIGSWQLVHCFTTNTHTHYSHTLFKFCQRAFWHAKGHRILHSRQGTFRSTPMYISSFYIIFILVLIFHIPGSSNRLQFFHKDGPETTHKPKVNSKLCSSLPC